MTTGRSKSVVRVHGGEGRRKRKEGELRNHSDPKRRKKEKKDWEGRRRRRRRRREEEEEEEGRWMMRDR